MAAIQLGNGQTYEGQIPAYSPQDRTDEAPSKIAVEISTELGDEQRNFPVTIDLNRNEAVALIAEIARALLPPTEVPLPPAKKRLLGKRIDSPGPL